MLFRGQTVQSQPRRQHRESVRRFRCQGQSGSWRTEWQSGFWHRGPAASQPGWEVRGGLVLSFDDIRGRLSGFHTVIMRANGAWKYGGCWPEPHGPCPPTRVNATLPEPIIWNPVWPYTPPPQRRKPGPLLACPGSVRPIRPPPHLSPAPDPPTELCGTQC